MDNKTVLVYKGITKKYGKFEAVKDFSLTLGKGKIIGLLGPNGSGKSTLIKMACGVLTPTAGEILIDGNKVGIETKKIVSYLPERTYLNNYMRVEQLVSYFEDFYEDFQAERAYAMLEDLKIDKKASLNQLSKGTKEKVQLILVMSRDAGLYILDEPIGGVDPAARDYILRTIISNYNPEASVIISTHLISDIENVLDEVVMIKEGELVLHKSVDELREEHAKSVDELFREVFKC